MTLEQAQTQARDRFLDATIFKHGLLLSAEYKEIIDQIVKDTWEAAQKEPRKLTKEQWTKLYDRMKVLSDETDHLIDDERQFYDKYIEILVRHCEIV